VEDTPLATAGKGQQTKTAASGLNNISTDQGTTAATNNIAANSVNTSGGLSPDISKALASEEGGIGKAYTGATQAAQRGLSMRGMGSAPSGLSASLTNTGINNMGEAQTGAIGGAFGEQNQLNQTAYNPVIASENAGNGAVNASTGANTSLASMPSTAGNVMSGLSGLAGIGTSLGGANGIFGKGQNGGSLGGG
jgi:hypothetical protein